MDVRGRARRRPRKATAVRGDDTDVVVESGRMDGGKKGGIGTRFERMALGAAQANPGL